MSADEDRAAVPPRLHFILARQARTAVVIRRGPSKSGCVIGWDLEDDSFNLGQWLRGRIYERRCDLSPDGRHLIYFAMNGRWSSPSKGAWTAISRAPWLKALTFLPKGDCWNGGGLFVSDREFWLNDGSFAHADGEADRYFKRVDRAPLPGSYGGECPGVYYLRLQRDGWTMKEPGGEAPSTCAAVFDKPLGAHRVLRKYAHATIERTPGRGCYFDTHALCDAGGAVLQSMPDWECADIDRGRVLWAAAGRLWSGKPSAEGWSAVRELHDSNEMTFEAREAPYEGVSLRPARTPSASAARILAKPRR